MKFLQAELREGLAWVRNAVRAFFRQPFAFAGLFSFCAMAVFALSLIPVVGLLALFVLAPVGTLLFMIASRRAAAGEAPLPGAFVELIGSPRDRKIALLKLGAAYLVAGLGSVLLIAVLEGGSIDAFVEAAGNPQASPEASAARMAEPGVQFAILLRMGIGALLSIPFWHAPGLVFWGGQSWAKALFFSTMAIWRNKGAFAVYAAAWIGLGVAFMMALGVVAALVGARQAQFAVVVSGICLFSTVLYASLWFTFAGCFGGDEPETEPTSVVA